MLAIGLVVDDAIVVVEAVERHIDDGLSPKEAALKAMEEISDRSLESPWFSLQSSFRQRSSPALRDVSISNSP